MQKQGLLRRYGALCGFAGLVLASLPLLAEPARSAIETYESPTFDAGVTFAEPASLVDRVASGELPPVAERLPQNPAVLPTSDTRGIGRSGGDLTMMVTRTKDTRLLVVYGYARLLIYNEDLDFVPDILESLEVEDGRIFTLTLRKGHRWSDGAPFTSEDFRYYWEDIANNEMLTPTGPPKILTVEGVDATVEILDEVTVRYSWPKPNPFFLPALAGASPLFIYSPSHYLKHFHERYGKAEEIAAAVEAGAARNWAQLHNRVGNLYKFRNPDLPTLQPWINTVSPPSTRFVAERNPYYHRIDEAGMQLPYLDRVLLSVVGSSLVPAKTGAGAADLQVRGLNFTDYTFLKENEERSGYDVRLWRTVRGSQLALYPNLNVEDPEWRKLTRDTRFRRALSLAIDRSEINQVIYYGLALEGNNSVLPDSPLYVEDNHLAWSEFDLDMANELLDSLGLEERNDEGIRLLPDGRPMEIVVETAGENTEEVDVLELIRDTWKQAGIKLFTKPSQREVLRNRIFAGETLMAMWFGYENGIPTADMSPDEFVPVRQHSYQWPKWGQFYETKGQAGEAVDMKMASELMQLYKAWIGAKSASERKDAWRRILEIHADEIYTIGLVSQVPQPIVVSKALRNVPEEGIYNWEPGAQIGIYRPEGFWIEQ